MSVESSPLDQYLYHLPEDKIAKHPLEDRDASKLLFYKDATINHTVDLTYKFLPNMFGHIFDLLVFNRLPFGFNSLSLHL